MGAVSPVVKGGWEVLPAYVLALPNSAGANLDDCELYTPKVS
jgi:hypothetical protein